LKSAKWEEGKKWAQFQDEREDGINILAQSEDNSSLIEKLDPISGKIVRYPAHLEEERRQGDKDRFGVQAKGKYFTSNLLAALDEQKQDPSKNEIPAKGGHELASKNITELGDQKSKANMSNNSATGVEEAANHLDAQANIEQIQPSHPLSDATHADQHEIISGQASSKPAAQSSSTDQVSIPDPSEKQHFPIDLAKFEQAKLFKIRTANRRHLDFDPEYDLNNVQASQRTKWSGPFHFIQAADCQFGMINSYVHHRTEPCWDDEIALCEQLVDVCNRMSPRPLFMIICGDLIDSLPDSEIGRAQTVDFKRIFAKLNHQIPLVCVCGNHDVGDEPTEKTINDYRRTFGDDYFYFTKNDILFIVINSQFYQHRENVEQIALEQDRWLEELLEKCKLFKYSFIFEHIPWFLEHPNEENDYFNIRREVRLKWLEKFKRAGVTKIMCGHYHRNAGGWYDGMELVVTTAIGAQCGQDKSGIRIVKVYDHSVEHQYYAMADIPLKIDL